YGRARARNHAQAASPNPPFAAARVAARLHALAAARVAARLHALAAARLAARLRALRAARPLPVPARSPAPHRGGPGGGPGGTPGAWAAGDPSPGRDAPAGSERVFAGGGPRALDLEPGAGAAAHRPRLGGGHPGLGGGTGPAGPLRAPAACPRWAPRPLAAAAGDRPALQPPGGGGGGQPGGGRRGGGHPDGVGQDPLLHPARAAAHVGAAVVP